MDGVYHQAGLLEGRANPGLRIAWKHPLGSGYSGVSVAAERAITMFASGKTDVLAAFDTKTGRELWRFEIGEAYAGHDGSHDGPIATPCIGGGQVFALGPRGRLVAVDAASGQLGWSVDLVADHGANVPFYGFGTSPILMDGVLIVEIGVAARPATESAEAVAGAAFAGFDPASGRKLWSSGDDGVAYQTPVPFEVDGRRQALCAGSKKLISLDPASGSLLWEHPFGGEGWDASSLIPVPAGQRRILLPFREKAAVLVELAQAGERPEIKPQWEERSLRNSFNVPVYHGGHIYGYTTRILTCVDAATGQSVWRSREPGDGFLSLADGRLVILTKEGHLHVARATPDGYQELAEVKVFDELAWTHPSIAGGSIYMRSLNEIARVDIVSNASAPVASAPPPARAGAATADLHDGAVGRFWVELAAADDKSAAIDRWMASQSSFPIIEGNNRVHFIFRGPAKDMAVAGDMFGARQERPMEPVAGTDLFHYSMQLEPDARVNYLFIKDYQEIPDPLNPRRTTTTIFGPEMEMSFTGAEMEMSWFAMPAWREPAHLEEPAAEAPRGRFESKEVESKHLKTKVALDVYLPSGYDGNDRRYPVLYIHGGQAARQHGKLATTLDNLIGARVAPIIAVFINNDMPFGGADQYAAMFAEELVPFVEQHYRTAGDAAGRASAGMGFSGYAAVYCAFKNPGVVAKLGAQSAFMLGSMMTGLEAMVPAASDPPLQIYPEWGKYDLRNPHEAWDMGDANRRFVELLRTKGYAPTGGEVHEGTGWSSWRNRTDKLLEALFPSSTQRSG